MASENRVAEVARANLAGRCHSLSAQGMAADIAPRLARRRAQRPNPIGKGMERRQPCLRLVDRALNNNDPAPLRLRDRRRATRAVWNFRSRPRGFLTGSRRSL